MTVRKTNAKICWPTSHSSIVCKADGTKREERGTFSYSTPKHQHEDTTTITTVRYCTMSRHAPWWSIHLVDTRECKHGKSRVAMHKETCLLRPLHNTRPSPLSVSMTKSRNPMSRTLVEILWLMSHHGITEVWLHNDISIFITRI